MWVLQKRNNKWKAREASAFETLWVVFLLLFFSQKKVDKVKRYSKSFFILKYFDNSFNCMNSLEEQSSPLSHFLIVKSKTKSNQTVVEAKVPSSFLIISWPAGLDIKRDIQSPFISSNKSSVFSENN